MADGKSKVDDKELVRAHVYTLLGEPEDGVLATRKAGIAYDAIREYSRMLSPISTGKLQDFYAEAAANGRREEFERALYDILYVYGLGRVGYTRLAKALGGTESAGDFLANTDKVLAIARQKSGVEVAYPSYSARKPEVKIVRDMPEEKELAEPEIPLESQPAEPDTEAVRPKVVTRRVERPAAAPEPAPRGTTWEVGVSYHNDKRIDVDVYDRKGAIRSIKTNAEGSQEMLMKDGKACTLRCDKDEILMEDNRHNPVARYQIKKGFFGAPYAVVEKLAPPADFPIAVKGARVDGKDLAFEQMKVSPDELARQKGRERQTS